MSAAPSTESVPKPTSLENHALTAPPEARQQARPCHTGEVIRKKAVTRPDDKSLPTSLPTSSPRTDNAPLSAWRKKQPVRDPRVRIVDILCAGKFCGPLTFSVGHTTTYPPFSVFFSFSFFTAYIRSISPSIRQRSTPEPLSLPPAYLIVAAHLAAAIQLTLE